VLCVDGASDVCDQVAPASAVYATVPSSPETQPTAELAAALAAAPLLAARKRRRPSSWPSESRKTHADPGGL